MEITGQDGGYRAEFLLDKHYLVHGVKRRTSPFNRQHIDHLYQDPHVADCMNVFGCKPGISLREGIKRAHRSFLAEFAEKPVAL